jgi:hypothetical protein
MAMKLTLHSRKDAKIEAEKDCLSPQANPLLMCNSTEETLVV